MFLIWIKNAFLLKQNKHIHNSTATGSSHKKARNNLPEESKQLPLRGIGPLEWVSIWLPQVWESRLEIRGLRSSGWFHQGILRTKASLHLPLLAKPRAPRRAEWGPHFRFVMRKISALVVSMGILIARHNLKIPRLWSSSHHGGWGLPRLSRLRWELGMSCKLISLIISLRLYRSKKRTGVKTWCERKSKCERRETTCNKHGIENVRTGSINIRRWGVKWGSSWIVYANYKHG